MTKISRFGFEDHVNQRLQAPKDVFSKHLAHRHRRFADPAAVLLWVNILKLPLKQRSKIPSPPPDHCGC